MQSQPGIEPEKIGQWSVIEQSPVYLEKLALLSHSSRELSRLAYVLSPLSEHALKAKQRCSDCGAHLNKTTRLRCRPPAHATKPKDSAKEPEPTVTDTKDPGVGTIPKNQENPHQEDDTTKAPRLICHSHPGIVRNKYFTCCHRHVSDRGCVSKPTHGAPKFSEAQMSEQWTYHHTPCTTQPPTTITAKVSGNITRAQRRLLAKQKSDIRQAIALDCEMGTASNGEPELIRLTAVDYFNNEILIDHLVKPSIPMLHYNTKYSGVGRSDMIKAERTRTCIFGRDAALKQLWRYAGPETIVIVHGGQNDFTSLRWIHPKIIDTFTLSSYEYGKVEGGRSLKNLSLQRLGRKIQMGKRGHCSLEDARACRELAHWFAEQIPSA